METYLSEITTLLPIYRWVFLGTAVIAYLLGSINPAVIVTRVWTKGKKDIRDMGSGNAGFTNVLRSVGKVPAIITIVCDALKCVAAVLLGGLFFSLMLSNHYGTQDSVLNLQLVNLGKYIAGIFCILGHSFPLYFHFKGGKGVVSAAALMLTEDWRVFLMILGTFLILFLITRVLKLLLTSFQFISAPIQYINVFQEMGSLALPFIILCLANWAMTTLFDGKGRFKDIYMAMCYALIPYILIQIPMIVVSNMLTYEEGSFYTVLLSFSVIWCVFLVFVGLMEVHDYGPGKTFIFLIVTIFGAAVIIFLLLVFFSLLGDALSYFISLYREIVFRLN